MRGGGLKFGVGSRVRWVERARKFLKDERVGTVRSFDQLGKRGRFWARVEFDGSAELFPARVELLEPAPGSL